MGNEILSLASFVLCAWDSFLLVRDIPRYTHTQYGEWGRSQPAWASSWRRRWGGLTRHRSNLFVCIAVCFIILFFCLGLCISLPYWMTFKYWADSKLKICVHACVCVCARAHFNEMCTHIHDTLITRPEHIIYADEYISNSILHTHGVCAHAPKDTKSRPSLHVE